MRRARAAILAAVATTALASAGMPGTASADPAAHLTVVASGLNQPKKVTIGPDGGIYVAESGLNTAAGCTDGSQPACLTNSGAVVRVSRSGEVTTVVDGLGSLASGNSPGSVGPVEALVKPDGHLAVLTQNNALDPTTGVPQPVGPHSWMLDSLLSVRGTSVTQKADLGAYEAANNPDHGAGSGSGPRAQPAIDSDPYGMVAYHGGLAIADAAGNDVLFYKDGHLSTLAVLPLITEHVPAGALGPGSPALTVQAQPVPTSVAVGPDGHLYIGELGGGPYNVGDTNIYRLTDHGLEVVASGLTMVTDIAFDHHGRLLALEVDQAGLSDPALQGPGLPTPGALIRINHDGSKTTLASTGLEFPLGLAVAHDGSIYLSNWGVVQGSHDPYVPLASGQLVKLTLGDS